MTPARAAVTPARTAVLAPLRRARLWLALLVVLVLAGVAVATLTTSPSIPLDTSSAAADGSRAAAAVLRHYGTQVRATTSLTTALDGAQDSAVLVTGPADYSAEQLRRLQRSAAAVVLVRPDTTVLSALDTGIEPDPQRDPSEEPDCADAGAAAAGSLGAPGDALAYTAPGSATSCYDGLFVVDGRLTVLGSADVLRNDHLARSGDAAVVVNALTRNRSLTSVVWLRPGADADGSGPATVWALFPDGAHRAFWWLAVVAALLVLWRGRRLGRVVTEPLPVVVRSAEIVEGHGRLYRRAQARDHAAVALRRATTRRLRTRLGLPRSASTHQIATAAAASDGRPPGEVDALLTGPTPTDDAALRRLARDLAELEGGHRQ